MRALFLFLFCSSQLLAQVNSSISHNGVNRTFVYYTPTNWNVGEEVPLVILLHGLTQTGAGVMDITQFNQLAEQHHFIVAYPDGLNFAWNANMNVSVSSADDLGFIETLAAHFQNTFNTHSAKQYLVGFSNGGFMSHKIACESSMCFAAIATVSGNMSDTTYTNCAPQFTPAVLHIHGTADAIVPYAGGPATGVSVDQTMQKWKNVLACSGSPVTMNMTNTNLFDLSSPQLITYQSCVSELKHVKIDGGGHQWPGIQTLLGGAGVINFDFYSPEFIWNFLSGKSCPTNSMDETENVWRVGPNPVNDFLEIATDDAVEYRIQDMAGSLVGQGTAEKRIELTGLSRGIYVLVLSSADRSWTVKILKEN